jgi:phytoene desaturase
MAKVVIVGAGLTGLCLSVLLRNQGNEVVVVEKNSWPGGIFASTQKKQYIFNSGLEFYFPHHWLLNFFNDAGEDITKFLEFSSMPNKYKVYTDSKSANPYNIIKLGEGFEAFESYKKTVEYLEGGLDSFEKMMNSIRPLMGKFMDLYESKQDTIDFEKFLLMHGFRGNLRDYLKRFFRSDSLLAALESFALFFGNTAQDTPAYYAFLLVEMFDSPLYKPKGGFTGIAQKLYFLALERGVTFWLEQEIETILFTNGKATDIKIRNSNELSDQIDLNRENSFEVPFQDNLLSFDYLVHTGDYESFEKNILKDMKYRNYTDAFYDGLEYAPSYTTFLLGLKKDLPNLEAHSFIAGKDKTKEELEASKRALRQSKSKATMLDFEAPLYFAVTPSSTDSEAILKIMSFQDPNVVSTKEEQDKLLLSVIERVSKSTKINLSEYIDTYISIESEELRNQYLYAKKSPYGVKHNLNEPSKFLAKINGKLPNIIYATNSNYPGGNGLFSIIRAKTVFRDIQKTIK